MPGGTSGGLLSLTPCFTALSSVLRCPGAGELQASSDRCEHLTCLLMVLHWESFLGETTCSPALGFWKLLNIISTLPGKHMAQTYELNNHFSPQQQLIVAYLLMLVYIAYETIILITALIMFLPRIFVDNLNS